MTLSTDYQHVRRFTSVSLLPLKLRNQANFGGSAFHFVETLAFHYYETLGQKRGFDYQGINPHVLK